MKKTFLLTLICYQICQIAVAQKVNIGEKCPDTKLTSLLNYKSAEANLLTAFNDKPLIIDFWFIRCPPCIATMIKLDSLQKIYKDQFNILMVTSEKEEDVKNFLNHNEKFKNLKQPIVYTAHLTSDLKKMFPHFGEPHEVWIGKNGIVQAITSFYEITSENIEKFLRGDSLNLPEKMDDFDTKYAMGGQALLISDEERSGGKRKIYYSWIGDADPRVPSLSSRRNEQAMPGIHLIYQNIDIVGLYREAYNLRRTKWQIESARVITVSKQFRDTLRLQSDYRTKKNVFCYEVFLRDSSESPIKKIMQRDLDNFFQLKSSIRRQDVQYYVLSTLKKHSNNAFSTKEKLHSGYIENKGDSISIKSMPLHTILENHLYNDLTHDIINETGYNGAVDIVIPQSKDIKKLKQALNKYGLDINQETREENVVILQDVDDRQ
ncbi:TlpA family protein disulfide reductase [Chitinophaga sp. G-6-1-13]|uniref:TlpA family protein disulfide reductase n=1 Tax=Chitinophaga fulva TaxID=2728842 RepID=A0A848GKK3_9BACT|nr:TlpA disulfide reductase family protein [Chitinophaga fulva]NML38856.1 TlpA family protein disulfide reductase [Chitinophaga fulva]